MSGASRRLSSVELGARSRAPSFGGPALGQAVEVQGNRGIVRFSGPTDFASGKWFGVELERALGKNDGSVQGKRYFECAPGHGVFVRSSQVKILTSSAEADDIAGERSRATIHGAEIRGGEPRLRAPGGGIPAGPSAEAARAARRATVQPGRIVPPSALLPSPSSATLGGSSIAPPPGASRLSGAFLQRGQARAPSPASGAGASARRLSGAPGMQGIQGPAVSRRSTLTGTRSPATADPRSGSRQTQISDTESTASRPASREQTPSRLRTETPSPSASRIEAQEQLRTPTRSSEPAAEEAARTPYRPALSMDESSAFDASPAGPALAAQTVPLKQYEELRLKFKFLEQKRSEDRQRLQEADKMRSEAEQALRVREKLAAKVSTQQNEVRTLRQQLKDATAAREDFEAKYTETLDAMEMLAVDKEMAEEKAESLAQEVGGLREQLAEAADSLDVYQQDGAAPPAVEQAQLQRQNERLKEALVRLRDVAAESEAQLNQRIKQLERDVQAAQEQADASVELREQLATAEAQIEDLKERLDDALGAEEMIESLADRNLDLSARVEELQGAVESLEALCEVNNEMEETRAEEEQGLRGEIERLAAVAGERARRIDGLEEAVADYQYNIKQYRELVATLQGDVQRLREREQTQATEAASISSKAQEVLSLNLQLRSTAMRSRAKAVDLELRRLDADQAAERLAMTEPFLPDHFFRSEGDALGALLAFRRLAAKADVLCKQLEQDEAAGASVSDAFVAAASVRALLAQFAGAGSLLAGFLAVCGEAEFKRLGSLLPDAQGMERRLNGLVDLVRCEEFRAPDALAEVRRLAAQLHALADAHVPPALPATAPLRLANAASRLAFAADVHLANLVFVEQLLAVGPPSEDSPPVSAVFAHADHQRITTGVLPAVTSVIQNCKSAKLGAIKLLRRAADMQRAGLVPSDRALEQTALVQQASADLDEFSVRVRTVIQDYFAPPPDGDAAADGDAPSVEQIGLDRLQQDLASVAQDVFGANDATPLGLALSASQRLGRDISALLAFLSDEQNSTLRPEPVPEAPWTKRAAQFKASLVQNADVEKRTQALNEEIVSLARELKLRDQAIQEGSVKVEMLEKRADTMRRQAEQVDELRRLLDTSRAKALTYEEAIESLQAEMDALESECRKLRQANAAAKQAAQTGANGAAAGSALPTDLLGLRAKITTLHDSVAYLRKENAHLRAKYLFKDEMLPADVLHPPKRATAAAVSEIVREAKVVAKEACRLAATPRLVRLAPKPVGQPAWQPLSSRPQFELYRQQTLAQTLKLRVESVQERLRSIPRLPLLVTTGGGS